jgi:hypothetical protein
MQDGRFISDDHILTDHAGANRTNRTEHGYDNGNIGIHHITDPCYQRDVGQFFIESDLFIEIHNDKDTFGPELSVLELNVIRSISKFE